MSGWGGVREGAGRKPSWDTKKVQEIMTCAYDSIQRWIVNPEVPQEKKDEFFQELIKRRIPNVIETDAQQQQSCQYLVFMGSNKAELAKQATEQLQVKEHGA